MKRVLFLGGITIWLLSCANSGTDAGKADTPSTTNTAITDGTGTGTGIGTGSADTSLGTGAGATGIGTGADTSRARY